MLLLVRCLDNFQKFIARDRQAGWTVHIEHDQLYALIGQRLRDFFFDVVGIGEVEAKLFQPIGDIDNDANFTGIARSAEISFERHHRSISRALLLIPETNRRHAPSKIWGLQSTGRASAQGLRLPTFLCRAARQTWISEP